jgi:ribonuclease HI
MIIVHTDGGARGNPGPAAIGIVIESLHTGKRTLKKYLGITTNNVAEYTAVLEALKSIIEEYKGGEKDEIHFFLDSQLVERQLSGVYKIKDPYLNRLAEEIQKNIRKWGKDVTFTYVPREQNTEADALVNAILDNR